MMLLSVSVFTIWFRLLLCEVMCGADVQAAVVEGLDQGCFEAFAGGFGQRLAVRVGDIKYVFGPFADGEYLGGLNADFVVAQHLADLAQQSGPVAGHDLDDGPVVDLIAAEADQRRCGEHAHLAGWPPGDSQVRWSRRR